MKIGYIIPSKEIKCFQFKKIQKQNSDNFINTILYKYEQEYKKTDFINKIKQI